MKERVSEQTAEFLLGIERIHTPLLPLYFLGTNDEVGEVSLERESCPSFHLLPGPKNNTSSHVLFMLLHAQIPQVMLSPLPSCSLN